MKHLSPGTSNNGMEKSQLGSARDVCCAAGAVVNSTTTKTMGVCNRGHLGLEMNPATYPSADSSLCHEEKLGITLKEDDEIPIVSLFSNQDDPVVLEAMKYQYKLGQESPSRQHLGFPLREGSLEDQNNVSILGKMSPMHELSTSLPNLAQDDSDNLNKMNEKYICNSYSDISDGLDKCEDIMQVQAKTKHISANGLSAAKGSPNGSGQPLMMPDDHTSPESRASKAKMLMIGQPQEVAISVNHNNNRLSAVLENIPLLYIPHTKQLISANCSKSESMHVPQGSARLLRDEQNPADEAVSDDTKSDHSEGRTLTTVNGESDAYATSSTLSQESDSSRSENTVLQDGVSTQGSARYEEADEDSIDELTKITLDRDSPKASLHRTNTMGSLSKTDASSFSSISSISTGTDFSASAASYSDDYIEVKSAVHDADETGFMDVNLHSRNTFERSSRNSSQDSGIDEKQGCGAKPKRRGISGFLSRSLFSRKTKEDPDVQSLPGWKLFGKVPPKHSSTAKDASQISAEYQAKSKTAPANLLSARPKRGHNIEVSSTTALILEQRPRGLPSKTPEEEQRHRLEYEAMIEAAKKREQKEAKQKKKQLQQQLRHEETLTASLRIWNNDILPNWETMRNSKKSRELWWHGLPPSIRGKVWKLAIGNDLNLTPELYEICLSRAKDRIRLIDESGAESDTSEDHSASKEASVELIKLDVSRTFPQLCIFQKGGPYHDLLHSMLGAYTCYRPDVGYVQGMSFLAAVLLLNMDVADAFNCFANLLNRPCQIAFFRLDEVLMKAYFNTYEEFFKENLPRLYLHFQKQNLTPDLYIIDWMFTLFSKSLPLDVACRVWDVFCRDGEEFLFRTALGILRMYDEILMNMDFIHLAQYLTKLPEDITGDSLFKSIECIHMNIDKKKFAQVLSLHREPVET